MNKNRYPTGADVLCFCIGLFFLFLVVVSPQLSFTRPVLLIPAGIFLSIGVARYVFPDEDHSS